MVAPGINIRVFDQAVYAPQISTAIMGCVGPATKGPVNEMNWFPDEGNFVNYYGRPKDRMYAQRAAIRYFLGGSQLGFVRVAGDNLASAEAELLQDNGLAHSKLVASSPGTWANDDLKYSILHNGTESYNILVYFQDQLVESHLAQDNGIVVTTLRNNSTRITIELASGIGAAFPAETLDPITGEVLRVGFSGGDDGAFAKTDSASSSTSGATGRRFYGKMDSNAANRVWENLLTIDGTLSGLAEVRGSVGMAVVPGTFTIRCETGAATYTELSDSGDLSYGPGGAGVGILEPSAGAHVGFIDYRTGNWGVLLSAATLFGGGSIDAIWVRGAQESVGTTAAGQGAYAGNLSQVSLAPGFFNANKVVITVPMEHVIGKVPTAVAGAASANPDLTTLGGWIVPGTVVLTPTHPTDPVPPPVYDDGFGGWRTGPDGTGVPVTGTIDYRTGQWAVTTWDPVGGVSFPALTGADLTAEYDIQVIDMGGGAVAGENGVASIDEVVQPSDAGGDANATDTDPGAQRLIGPISPGSAVLVISDVGGSPETYYDDGVGGWLDRPRGDPRAAAAAGGAIDYTTGAWSITASGAITAAATIKVTSTTTPWDKARRALRGTGPLFRADTTPDTAGMNLDAPAAANDYNGTCWLDHTIGAFAFELDLVESGDRQFDVADNLAIEAVYLPADILGWGDGIEVVFTGELSHAPYRRAEDGIVGFQGAQAANAGAGDPQVTFADLGASADADFWSQNVALSTDPENSLDFRDGGASIKWTSAPLPDEAVFVAASQVVLHLTARYPGDIGNERSTVAEGFRAEIDEDPSLAGTLRLRVLFDTGTEESFGQATDLDELIAKVNDELNGSDLVRAEATGYTGALTPAVLGGSSQVLAMGGAFTIADIVGTKVGQVTTGMQMFRNEDVVPLNWIMCPGQWHRQVIQGMQQLCERPGRRAMGIIPIPDATEPSDHDDFYNGNFNSASVGGIARPTVLVPYPPLSAIDTPYLASIMPWLENYDQYTAQNTWEPPDGEMARLLSLTPEAWFPIAGFRRGRVSATAVRYSVSREDRDFLQGLVGTTVHICNPIVRKEGRGLVLYGQQTAKRTPSATDRINVMWTVNVIMNLLDAASQEFPFEINDAILWREIATTLNDILKPLISQRGLTDAYIVVDASTTTPTDVDQLTVNAKLFIKPVRAAEFINYDLILTPTGADFAEVLAAGS